MAYKKSTDPPPKPSPPAEGFRKYSEYRPPNDRRGATICAKRKRTVAQSPRGPRSQEATVVSARQMREMSPVDRRAVLEEFGIEP